VEIRGITFFGATLWSNFGENPLCEYQCSKTIGDFRHTPFTTQDIRQEFYDTVEFLYETNLKDAVVITHFSPSMQSSHEKWAGSWMNPYFHNSLEHLILDKQPTLWIHGHTHDFSDYKIGDTRVYCNPLGYPSEKNELNLQLIDV
jgi:Icc-related predicted phosphoesterase